MRGIRSLEPTDVPSKAPDSTFRVGGPQGRSLASHDAHDRRVAPALTDRTPTCCAGIYGVTYCSPWANSPALTAPTNVANAAAGKTRAGPSGSLLSRTGTMPGMNPRAASMQLPPLSPL